MIQVTEGFFVQLSRCRCCRRCRCRGFLGFVVSNYLLQSLVVLVGQVKRYFA